MFGAVSGVCLECFKSLSGLDLKRCQELSRYRCEIVFSMFVVMSGACGEFVASLTAKCLMESRGNTS